MLPLFDVRGSQFEKGGIINQRGLDVEQFLVGGVAWRAIVPGGVGRGWGWFA